MSHSHTPHTSGHTIRWAKWYDAAVQLIALGREGTLRRKTIALAQIQPGETILDVGCGTGTLTLAAKRAAGEGALVVGIDAAPEMIDVAQGKATQAGLDVTFASGLIEAIDYPDETFDLVLSSLMFHHLPGTDLKQQGLAEIWRVLRPFGRFLIVDFFPGQSAFSRLLARIRWPHARAHVIDLPAQAREAGFTAIETGQLGVGRLAYVSGRKPEPAS